MECPTCKSPLTKRSAENQEFLHCTNCGATFFEENSINRISLAAAETLAGEKKITINPPAQISCPRDSLFLLPVEEESIPPHVRLYQCPICKGVFGSPEDIVNFKKAQEAKINYFKMWQIPLPALRSVVVFGFVALLSLAVLLSTSRLGSKTLTNTQATTVISNVVISKSNQYLFITFRTDFPLKSNVMFVEQQSGGVQVKEISSEFTQLHQLVTGDLDLSREYHYKIELTDQSGNSISTELQPLQLSEE